MLAFLALNIQEPSWFNHGVHCPTVVLLPLFCFLVGASWTNFHNLRIITRIKCISLSSQIIINHSSYGALHVMATLCLVGVGVSVSQPSTHVVPHPVHHNILESVFRLTGPRAVVRRVFMSALLATMSAILRIGFLVAPSSKACSSTP